MPASRSPDERQSDGGIRAAVVRLARSNGDGGAVIERAAIMAEGAPAAAIEAWIIEHGGQPEAPIAVAAATGLYRAEPDVASNRAPRRYLISADALAER